MRLINTRAKWLMGTTAIAALGCSLLVASPAFADTTLSGTVLDAGVPVENADVEIYQYVAADDEWEEYTDVTTAADGSWSLSGTDLDDGSYATYYELDSTSVLYSTDQGWNGTVSNNDLTQQFTVTGGVASATNLTENLVRNAGVVKLTAIDSATNAPFVPSTNNGYGYVQFYFYNGYTPEDGYVQSNFNASESYAEIDGNLVATRVQAATYTDGYTSAYLNNAGYYQGYLPATTVVAGATTDLGNYKFYVSGTPSVSSTFATSFSPRISGVAKVGNLLSVSTPAPLDAAHAANFTFQWYTDDHPIIGATSRTFVPTTTELGSQLYVRVIASLDGYAQSSAGNYNDTKPVQIGDPTAGSVAISGTVAYGNTVTASVSTALAGANSFQWYLNGNPIAGATGSTYAIKATDIGSSLSVSVKSTVQGHTDAVIPSAGVIVKSDAANSGSVSITGSAKLGKTVSAKVSTALAGNVSYKWFRNGTLIGGVDGSKYTIGKADLGKTITVTATSAVQGHADAVLVATVAIAKDSASVKATAKGDKVTITVKPGATKIGATAKVKVYYTAKKFATVTVKSGKSASVSLKKLKKGTHTVKVAYQGNSSYKAKTVTIKVKVTK